MVALVLPKNLLKTLVTAYQQADITEVFVYGSTNCKLTSPAVVLTELHDLK